MDSLTVRQKFILHSVIEKGPLKLKDLSQQIDVSKRTVLREVSVINGCLRNHKIRISDVGGHLHVNGSRENLDKVRELLVGIPPLWLLTREQRQALITAQLLLAHEPVKSAYFSCQFNVVEGTIIFYLDKIQSWLREKKLCLVRKRGYGLQIEGSDWNKRNAFAELIYSYKPMSELLSFLYGDNNDYSLHSFFRVTFGEDLVDLTRKLLKKLTDRSILKNNDVGYFGAFLHLLLAIRRSRIGSYMELPEYLGKSVLSSDEFSFVKDIDKLLQESDIKLPDNELVYLAVHLNGDKRIYMEDKKAGGLGFDINDLVREIVYLTGKWMSIKVECDTQLMAGLIQHINPALYRLTMGLEVRNPIINEIREYYSELFDAVSHACRLVFSKYNLLIPANEVGYITMHIGAAIERQQGFESRLKALIICPNGVSTAKILYNKLKSSFPELENVDLCSLREMKERVNDGYDLVLSTVNINVKTNDEIIVVSPFLPRRDIERIGNIIKSKVGNRAPVKELVSASGAPEEHEMEGDFDIANHMLKNFGMGNISSNNFDDSIREIVDQIYGSKVRVDKGIIEQLIREREDKGNVVIPQSHVALLHIRTEEIHMPFVGVYRMKGFIHMKSAGFSEENVDTFLVMLARKDESNYILELLGRISISLVENREFAEVLRLGDVKDIRNELIEMLNREEY